MSSIERPVRVLLVGRHFWPHGSVDSAGHLMDLSTGLHNAGLHITVLTPKHAASWAECFSFREYSVRRPLRVFRTGWTARGDRSISRYLRSLRDWIETNAASFDVLYCDWSREEAIAVIDAARTLGLPVVTRIAGQGRASDLDFFADSRMGKRCRSMVASADAVVLGDARGERRWISMDGVPERTVRIPIGIGPTVDPGVFSRDRLRRAMARINGDLYIPEHASVVLSVERFERDSGVMQLVKSAYSLSNSIAGLQFWLIGDGPQRDSIYTRLKSDGLRQSMAMPGSFAIIDDVFKVADVLVHVGDEGFDHQVPAAIAAGLPMVVGNTATARDFFAVSESEVHEQVIEKRFQVDAPPRETDTFHSAEHVGWFDPERPKTLRFAIERVVNNLESARRRADELRRRMQRERPRSDSLQRYLRLFRDLAAHSRSQGVGSVTRDSASMKKVQ